jgi:hypothetical protein
MSETFFFDISLLAEEYRWEREKERKIESKSIISIFTILDNRLILFANHSNGYERK